MTPEKATILVFSPTGTSKKSAAAVARGLGCPVEVIDLTVPGAAAPRAFGPDEVVVLGAPCYSGRVPQIAMSRFAAFRGPCCRGRSFLCAKSVQNGDVPLEIQVG